MRDAACPLSTRGGTRLVRLVRGRGGGGRLVRGVSACVRLLSYDRARQRLEVSPACGRSMRSIMPAREGPGNVGSVAARMRSSPLPARREPESPPPPRAARAARRGAQPRSPRRRPGTKRSLTSAARASAARAARQCARPRPPRAAAQTRARRERGAGAGRACHRRAALPTGRCETCERDAACPISTG